MCITGSHDSFTQSLDAHNDMGPDCSVSIKEMCKLFGTAAKSIVYRWSVTQSLSFRKQLQAGIRYFDFRICSSSNCTSSDGILFSHGLLGSKVEPCLRELNAFLEEHPKEIVLVDFNHFYCMSETAHTILLHLVLDIFGSKICPYMQGNEMQHNLTLASLWERRQQIIVFYQCDMGKTRPEFWPQTSIFAPWGNTCDISKLMIFLEENYKKRQASQHSNSAFYVCQGVLTPDFTYMMGHFMGNLRDDLAAKVLP